MKESRTEHLDKRNYRTYLQRASECAQLMDDASQRGLWGGALVNAVHCAISACDAVTTYYLGERSSGQRHTDVVFLLQRSAAPEAVSQVRRVQAILSKKSEIEYGATELPASRTRQVIEDAHAVLSWARRILPSGND